MSRARTAPRVYTPDELTFQDALKLHLGATPWLRWWRQNVGKIPIRDRTGKIVRVFDPGPPTGAADLSGIVLAPSFLRGLRLEVELKSATGTRSEEQIAWADFITSSGGVYALVGYDAGLSLKDNVALGARIVIDAIHARAA